VIWSKLKKWVGFCGKIAYGVESQNTSDICGGFYNFSLFYVLSLANNDKHE
jgi:hypothetical protein